MVLILDRRVVVDALQNAILVDIFDWWGVVDAGLDFIFPIAHDMGGFSRG